MTSSALDGFRSLGARNGSRWDNVHMPLGAEWLAGEIDQIAEWVRRSATSAGTRNRPRRFAVRGLNTGSLGVLAGPAEVFAASFLDACIYSDVDRDRFVDIQVPWTAPRALGGTSYGHDEPCGVAITSTNLGPEWIRHFLGVFYSKNVFKDVTAQDFYPFENRDHFVHSLIVLALGDLVLQLEVDPDVVTAVSGVLGKPLDSDRPIHKVADLILSVYARTKTELVRGESNWLLWAWPAVALWHDAGYDAATWCLLTFREFCHSHAVNLPTCAGIPERTFNDLNRAIGVDLTHDVQTAITTVDWSKPYKALWEIEGCSVQDKTRRPWGRLHALFSAYEFLKCFAETGDPTKASVMLKHLAVAIAEHHEPWGEKKGEGDGQIRERLVMDFVRNPMGELLKFVDALAAFSRVKVVALDEPAMSASGQSGKIVLQFDYNADPLWKVDNMSQSGFYRGRQFYRGRRFEPMEEWKQSLWGTVLRRREEKRKPEKPAVCKRICPGRNK